MINISDKYCYSFDDERYQGEFDSEQDAINEARVNYPDKEYVYIGTCVKPELRWRSNEEQVIESIRDNLFDEVGEWAENFEVSTQNELDLALMIDETVKAWIEKNKIDPCCYLVLDGHEVPLINYE